MTEVLALQALPDDQDSDYLQTGGHTSGFTSSCSTAWVGTGHCWT